MLQLALRYWFSEVLGSESVKQHVGLIGDPRLTLIF